MRGRRRSRREGHPASGTANQGPGERHRFRRTRFRHGGPPPRASGPGAGDGVLLPGGQPRCPEGWARFRCGRPRPPGNGTGAPARAESARSGDAEALHRRAHALAGRALVVAASRADTTAAILAAERMDAHTAALAASREARDSRELTPAG